MDYIYTSSDNQSNKKFTIFSIPKTFQGHIETIQRNAIHSWTLLTPKPEIILFGDEAGTREICQEFDLIHIVKINRNEYGTPLLDDIFATVHSQANTDIIVYINADIILTNDFSQGIQSVSENLDDYLLVGRRWDVDIHQELEFNSNWKADLDKLIHKKGYLGDYDCKDYFVFPKHLFVNIPRFAVGRGYWDTWIVTNALAHGYPVVDGSLVITAIHQNHPYTHIRGGRNEAYMGREAEINKSIGNVNKPGNIACATWQLNPLNYKNTPKLSVVIVTHKASATIEKAVLSVLIQDYKDYEIIVVNCGCDDKTASVLQAYKHNIRYYGIEDQNISNAYIYSLNLARGELVVYLDANSIMLPRVLSQQVLCFEQEASTLDILFSGCRIIEGEKVIDHKLWKDLPDLENIKQKKLPLSYSNSLPREVNFMFRRHRVTFFKLMESNWVIRRIFELISIRGCKAKWFKSITKVQHL